MEQKKRNQSKMFFYSLLAIVFTLTIIFHLTENLGFGIETAYAKTTVGRVTNVKQTSTYSTTKISMKWKKVSGATAYAVYRATTQNGKYKYIKSVTANSCSNSGLQSGTRYYYKIRAYKKVNGKKVYGAYSNAVRFLTKPTVPTVSVKEENNTAKIRWSKSKGANGYEIYMSDSRNGTYSKIKTTGSTTTSYSKSGLAEEKTYYFKLRTYKLSDNGSKIYSDFSSIESITIERKEVEITSILLDRTSVTLEVGETILLNASVYPRDTTQSKVLNWSSNNQSVVTVTQDGRLHAVSPGKARITVKTTNNKMTNCTVNVIPSTKIEAAEVWGFSISSWSPNDTYKVERENSRNKDGSNTYSVEFYCDGNENWLDTLTFLVEDVTPNAYKKMFADMNILYEAPKTEITSAKSRSGNLSARGYNMNVQEPFDEYGPGSYDAVAKSGKILTIQAGASVRALKVTALLDGEILDYLYVVSDGKNKDYEYAQYDLDLYKQVRMKVEKALWTDDMDNADKLAAISSYINKTAHYPGTYTTSKQYNPSYWADWSVDGVELYYYMTDDVILNRIMDFQGGIITCQAADIIIRVAVEDLGLPYLYDYETDTIADGEGVWIGIGSYSTSPSNPYHETSWYKDSSETVHGIDTQGMGNGMLIKNSSCEQHGCKEYIVSLE